MESSPRIALPLLLTVAALWAGCAAGPGPQVRPAPPAAAATAAPSTTAAATAAADPDPGPADLSLCMRPKARLLPEAAIDVRHFAARLHGTWELSTRTIAGLTIDTNSRFYFDLGAASEEEATGTALLVDYGNLSVLDPLGRAAACRADATVAALWKVRIQRLGKDTVRLVMDGRYYGSYGDFLKGITATEQATFLRRQDDYLSGGVVSPAGGQGIPDDVWDRIGLTGGTLTYVSCANRYIDRYVKVSSASPRVDDLPLEEAWNRRVKDGTILVPVKVEPGGGG